MPSRKHQVANEDDKEVVTKSETKRKKCKHAANLSLPRFNGRLALLDEFSEGCSCSVTSAEHTKICLLCVICLKMFCLGGDNKSCVTSHHRSESSHSIFLPILNHESNGNMYCSMCKMWTNNDTAAQMIKAFKAANKTQKTKKTEKEDITALPTKNEFKVVQYRDKICGLNNLGSTCYMNATLQAPVRCSKFNSQGNTGVDVELSNLLGALREGRQISTKPFFMTFSRDNQIFEDVNEQQDAHDFLRTLFNCLDEKLLRPFFMELETRISSLECKQEHTKIEKALDLNVLIDCFNISTLEDRLQTLSLEDEPQVKSFETKQDLTKYTCDNCKQETEARLIRSIKTLPEHHLILHFNRFIKKKRSWQKDSTIIDIPLRLAIKEGIHEEEVVQFELLSIVEHQGHSMDSGHYISVVRGKTATLESNTDREIVSEYEWYWISDDRIRTINQNGKVVVMKGRQPYLAFYSRIEE